MTLGIILFFVGYLADRVQEKGYLTTTQVRKYFNCAAFVSQTIFMVLVAFATERVLIIIFITFGAGETNFYWLSFSFIFGLSLFI